MSARGTRHVLHAAAIGMALGCYALVFGGLAWAGGAEEEPRICPELVEIVVPLTHKGVRYERLPALVEVPVPCDSKPPSSARVELEINPVPVDMDREAVDGEAVSEGE